MSQIINTNRAVRVRFDPYTSNAQLSQSSTADIYVPFLVKEILIKGIDIDFLFDFRTMYFTSSLVDGNVLGSGFAGAVYDTSSTTKQLRYIFNTPREINGSFRFDYFLIDNNTGASYNNAGIINGAPTGYVLFVIEFVGELSR